MHSGTSLRVTQNFAYINFTLVFENHYVIIKLQPSCSTWTPPEGSFPALDLFIKKCRHDVSAVLKKEAAKPALSSNLSAEEKIALNKLRNNKDYVIKSADKGGAVVVWRRDLYIAEGLRQLDDTEFYEEIDIDPTNDYQNIVRKTVSKMIHTSKLPADAIALVYTEEPQVTYLLHVTQDPQTGKPWAPYRIYNQLPHRVD